MRAPFDRQAPGGAHPAVVPPFRPRPQGGRPQPKVTPRSVPRPRPLPKPGGRR